MSTQEEKLPGVEIERDGEIYLSIPRAAAYLGKSRATLFRYINDYNWETYSLPLQGKSAFLRKRDVDTILTAQAVIRRRHKSA